MTTYKIVKLKNSVRIEVSGHTGYADDGFDIICASISTSCILTANLLEKLGYNILELVSKDGYFKLHIKKDNDIALTIFNNLVDTLDELQKYYPNFIKKIK